eukprot:scaffold236557_cov28-Tisochrysis_lutea.AAC.4
MGLPTCRSESKPSSRIGDVPREAASDARSGLVAREDTVEGCAVERAERYTGPSGVAQSSN